jgi:hypothetical protein
MLHAVSITLEATPGGEITIEAPVPESFRQVVERFAAALESRPHGR